VRTRPRGISRALRVAAWAVVATGVAAPLVRRRLNLSPPVVLGAAWTAPVALCVAVPRTPPRDFATACLQMWAYVNAYAMPNDDPTHLEQRVRIDYPIKVDRAIGLGTLPGLRLQRTLGVPERIQGFEKPLVWAHWVWFFVPHGTVAYILFRHRDRFPRAATMLYAVFDLGAIVYWAVPTAPPWYASQAGRVGETGDQAGMRRMMAEYGAEFWKDLWEPLYGVLGGNPLAAMPSLHFATSVMAAHLLAELGPVEGALGWGYAATLGVALVYLGEHYVVDLLAGLALTEGIVQLAPRAAPALRAFSRGVSRLEARAAGA
jgi:membrane-associated phospholipid phosphatase